VDDLVFCELALIGQSFDRGLTCVLASLDVSTGINAEDAGDTTHLISCFRQRRPLVEVGDLNKAVRAPRNSPATFNRIRQGSRLRWLYRLAARVARKLCVGEDFGRRSPVNSLAAGAVEPGGGDDLASLAAGAAVQLRDQITHWLGAAGEQQFVKLCGVVPERRRTAGIGLPEVGDGVRQPDPGERVTVIRQRRAEADLNARADRLISVDDSDNRGGAIGFRAEDGAAVAGNDDQRSGRCQHGGSDHTQAIAELSAMRQAKEFARAQRPGDAEQFRNLFRCALEARPVVFDEVAVRLTLDEAVANVGTGIERIVGCRPTP
jgi:hypothetical protein